MDWHVQRSYRIDPATGSARNFFSSVVYTVTEATDGSIWVGTIDGLLQYDKTSGEFTAFRTSDGLPSNVICGLETDFEGNIWMSTHSGIARMVSGERSFSVFTDSTGSKKMNFPGTLWPVLPGAACILGILPSKSVFFRRDQGKDDQS